MRYGYIITLVSALKLAYKKRSLKLFKDYMRGYVKARYHRVEKLVTKEQGRFIRRLRWKGMITRS